MGNVRPGGRAAKDRREAAAVRLTARATLGDAGQLAKLEKQGHSHCKEAKRLRARLGVGESSSPPPLTMSKFASKAEYRRAVAQREARK